MQQLSAMLRHVVDGNSDFSANELELLAKARRRWPYASVFQLMSLLHDGSLSKDDQRAIRLRLALTVDDPRIFNTTRDADWHNFYPPQVEEPVDVSTETDRTIDLFLSTYGHTSPEEDALLERMIFNPQPDYGEMLAREEQENLPATPVDPETPQGRIDSFILSRHPAAHSAPQEPEKPADEEQNEPIARPADDAGSDALLSESLARIFVRQGRYERAYDIISSLNLKFPKKSAYFADQLRFLQKLIINQRWGEDREKADASLK